MKKKKILIIEDDKSLVRIIENALDEKKFKIYLTISCEEGIEKAKMEKPDLIVLDVLLPGKSGFECLKALKEEKTTKKIPVIMLSNLGQSEEIRKCIELGAIGYMVKADFTIDEVIDKINKAINKK